MDFLTAKNGNGDSDRADYRIEFIASPAVSQSWIAKASTTRRLKRSTINPKRAVITMVRPTMAYKNTVHELSPAPNERAKT